jgi:heptosyltransferase-2
MGWGRLVIVSSNAIASHMLEDFGVPFGRLRFIPRGVDISRFRYIPPSERHNKNYTVAIIGRIAPIKGHGVFLKAIAKAIKTLPNVRAIVVGQPSEGKGNYLKQLANLADRLGISDSVEFGGAREDIPGVMSRIDLLVMPSTGHEAFGRVVIEAQAAGVPVIATKVGGLTDIIDDRKNGILVTPWNVGQLADAIIEVLKDKKLAETLAVKARQDVQQRFTLSVMADKTIGVYNEALDNMKILVIKIGASGDVVLVTPSLRAIRERFPKAHIAVLVGVESRQILQNCPYVDELIAYNRPFIKRSVLNFMKLAADLRRAGFDIVIDFQNSSRSHALAFLSLAPKRFGYKNKKLGFLLNYGIKDVKASLPPLQHQFRVLSLLDIKLKDERLEVWPTESDSRFVDEFLAGQWTVDGQPLVGINIGGSSRWRTKRWPQEKLSRLCDELATRNARVVLTGVKADYEAAMRIISDTQSKPINAVGKTTLNQLAALIKRCKVFITTDSAPLHIAAASGVPVVAVFGPTDPVRHCPSAKNITVITKGLKCSPCYKPVCKSPRCMEDINMEEIVQAAERLKGIS